MAVTSTPMKSKKTTHEHDEANKKKRSSCPGVRVINGKVYDSENGKTCHQCRQKTRDFQASCKNQKGNKQCPIGFCHKCLLNRYGENAEEVLLLDDWKCPKCRGICNCSFCRKKSGHKPTGILVRTAKENGFSSVSELLQVKGPENFGYERVVSPKKNAALSKASTVTSPGKENSFEGNNDVNSYKNLSPISKEKNTKKDKRAGLSEVSNGNRDADASLPKKAHKKPRISEEALSNKVKTSENDISIVVEKKKPKKNFEDVVKKDKNDKDILVAKKKSKTQNQPKDANIAALDSHKILKCNGDYQEENIDIDVKLPPGACLTTVCDIELRVEVVGHALQFLEFCSAFAKILDLKKGQAEAVLREIVNGRATRRSQYSLVARFHIELLSLIQEDAGEISPTLTTANGKNSWLLALGRCVSECQPLWKEFPSACFDSGNEGYNNLDISEKLKLLNFLCDEALNTRDLRDWINSQHSEFNEKRKQAKDQERQMKQKISDEVAKSIVAKNGAPLSVSEHHAIVSEIKSKAAKVHAEILEAKGVADYKRQRCDAVRTDPILLDDSGRAFWRLKVSDSEEDILLQDVGMWTSNATYDYEKWFVYDAEQKGEIEKYITSIRTKRLRAQKAAETISIDDDDDNDDEVDL